MSKPIIEIENISKRYQIGANKEPYLSLRDEVAKFASRLRPRSKVRGQSSQDFWALKDVSFNVEEGDAVGIIGRNGAGKSTVLKILSQITPPTEGKIIMRGRVASLLEVGTGFHPELTGRENIYLNGTILGMTRSEVSRKFDEIVAFAEVEKFLETPVKRYSSGMYVRLAFAVAAHLEPEILVVDEVLAVGDAEFQQKCLGKMSEVAKGGRTVLFVSHNMAAISAFCSKCITFESGRIVARGTTHDCISKYLNRNKLRAKSIAEVNNLKDKSYIKSCFISDMDENIVESVQSGDNVKFNIECFLSDNNSNYFAAIDFYSDKGIRILYCNSSIVIGKPFYNIYGAVLLQCSLPRLPLMPGAYFAHISLNKNNERVDLVENAICFEVIEGDFWNSGRFVTGPNPPLFLVDQYWSCKRQTNRGYIPCTNRK
jgi:lipopolysaccharide transport system ATP-binding protein